MLLKKILFTGIMTLALASGSVTAHADKVPYMERVNVNWDLRPDGVFIPYQAYTAGVGYMDSGKMGFRYFDVEKLSNGLVNVKFKLVFKDKNEMDKDKIHAIANSGYGTKRISQCSFVNYETGKWVVPVNVNKWKYTHLDTYFTDEHGCRIDAADGTLVGDVDIKIPDDGLLCVVAGGSNKKFLDDETMDDNFMNGTGKIGSSGYIAKNNSQVAHGMKILLESLKD